jgi:hypothetical protein
VHQRGPSDHRVLLAVADAAVIFAPRHFTRATGQHVSLPLSGPAARTVVMVRTMVFTLMASTGVMVLLVAARTAYMALHWH